MGIEEEIKIFFQLQVVGEAINEGALSDNMISKARQQKNNYRKGKVKKILHLGLGHICHGGRGVSKIYGH